MDIGSIIIVALAIVIIGIVVLSVGAAWQSGDWASSWIPYFMGMLLFVFVLKQCPHIPHHSDTEDEWRGTVGDR